MTCDFVSTQLFINSAQPRATMSSFQIQNLEVVNEAKAGVPIHTGVGFLDHMLDQLNSHAQVGIGLEVMTDDDSQDVTNHNRLADCNQVNL
jgi:imidazoleglycerol phosphate dehydratase HisB